MPFTPEELEEIRSEFRVNHPEKIFTDDLKILECDGFLKLADQLLKMGVISPIHAMGWVVSTLEIGIAIGRKQATRELLDKIGK